MGGYLSNPVDQTIKKNQEYISEMNKIKMERWIQMHYQIKEREIAMEISKYRELFYWISSMYGFAVFGIFARFRQLKRIGSLAPIIPLSIIEAYYADLAYGSKIHRIRAEADMIMLHEAELLEWPSGLPTVSSIDQARVEVEIENKMHPHSQ